MNYQSGSIGSVRSGRMHKGAGLFPHPDNREAFTEMIHGLIDDYYQWHELCAEAAGPAASDGDCSGIGIDGVRALVKELSGRMARESTPWPSPLYLAHMTADTPIAASLAYFCALLYNPNNVAPEVSPVTTELEHDVSDDLCRLVGYRQGTGWAHLCSGGHAANYEAIWIARNLRSLPRAAAEHPESRDLLAGVPRASLVNLPVGQILDLVDALAGRGTLTNVGRLAAQIRGRGAPECGKILLARNSHYAWDKCADLLGLGPDDVEVLGLDRDHRLHLPALERRVRDLLERGRPILAVVATLGSAGEGSVDDLHGIMRLREDCERRYGASFYVHVDAASGGYFRTIYLDEDGSMTPYDDVAAGAPVQLKPEVYEAFRTLPLADSVTVDPHKSGHAPYPAGGLVLRDRRAAGVIASRSTYFGQDDGNRFPFGPYTLEGTRPGAAAAAVWAMHRLIGLHAGGYGRLLGGCIVTAQRLHQEFRADGPSGGAGKGPRIFSCYEPDLNILNLTAEPSETCSAGTQRDTVDVNQLLLDRLRADTVIAPMTSLWVSSNTRAENRDRDVEQVLRLCVMKELDPTMLDRVGRALRDRIVGHLSAMR